jgi:hypothetical protein
MVSPPPVLYTVMSEFKGGQTTSDSVIIWEIAMLKRIADWLEKVSVAALAVGVFQGQTERGLIMSFIAFTASLIITKRIGGE